MYGYCQSKGEKERREVLVKHFTETLGSTLVRKSNADLNE